MNPDPDRLRTQPLFASLSEDELARVASWLEVRTAGAGERLTPEGASGYTFFLIEEGSARVSRDGAPIRELGPGEFFGEMAILGDGRRSADVEATSAMTLFAIFGADFRQMEAELPEIARMIQGAAAERSRT